MTERGAFRCALALACLVGDAAAQEQQDDAFMASVFTGLEHSTNALEQRDGGGANIGRIGLVADLAGNRRRLDYSLQGSLSWADYFTDDLPSALEGGLSGSLKFGAEDDLLQWVATDSIRQSLLAPQGNATPDNSEYVNTFSTGPTFTLQLGDRAALILSGVYSLTSYENSPLDTNSVSGNAGVSFLLPRDGSVGLYAGLSGTSHVNDAVAQSGYDLREAYLRYQSGAALGNSSLSMDAGYVESSQDGSTIGGPLVRFSLQQRLSAISSLFLSANKTITNVVEPDSIKAAGLTVRDIPISAPGTMASTGFEAGWTANGRRNALSVNGGLRKEEYQSTPLFDRKVAYFGASFSRRLRSTLTATLGTQYNSEDFADPALPEFDYQSVGFSLDQRFGRRISGGLTATYSHRTDKVTSDYEFTEWRYGLTVRYLLTDPNR